MPWPPPQEKGPAEASPHKIATDETDNTLEQHEEQQSRRPLKARTKAASVLRILLERGDLGLNCFEAVRLAHDYVLRTTVSNLQIQYGVTFERRYEQVSGYAGSTVDCVRYSLTAHGRERAAQVLAEAT